MICHGHERMRCLNQGTETSELPSRGEPVKVRKPCLRFETAKHNLIVQIDRRVRRKSLALQHSLFVHDEAILHC